MWWTVFQQPTVADTKREEAPHALMFAKGRCRAIVPAVAELSQLGRPDFLKNVELASFAPVNKLPPEKGLTLPKRFRSYFSGLFIRKVLGHSFVKSNWLIWIRQPDQQLAPSPGPLTRPFPSYASRH